MENDEFYDPAHEHDMAVLRREQLEMDISPEEAAEYLESFDDDDFDYE